MDTKLRDPINAGGIRAINYFNGRLLTANDLVRDQLANRQTARRLGMAIGDGVVSGLEVSVSPSSTLQSLVLQVTSGIAVNRSGGVLRLPEQAQVTIAREATRPADTANSRFFAECQPPLSGSYIAGQGVYVLAISPAETREGRAMTSGLGNEAASCNTDTIVEGIQFRLLQIDSMLTAGTLGDEALIRSRVAAQCFGVDQSEAFGADPLGGMPVPFNLLDQLRQGGLGLCDVPLAVVYATLSGGIRFVDNWSVRRQATALGSEDRWSHVTGQRRRAEAEAVVLWFLEAISSLNSRLTTVEAAAARVQNYFTFLPPCGLIPAKAGAIDPRAFLGTRLRGREVLLEKGLWRTMLAESVTGEPVSIQDASRIHAFVPRENFEAGNTVQNFWLFCTDSLLARFHIPVAFGGAVRLDADGLSLLFRETLDRYEGLRAIISAASGLTDEDQAGILVISQITVLVRSLDFEANARMLTQTAAVAAFDALARVQEQFITIFRDVVLKQVDTSRYGQAFTRMIDAIDELLHRQGTSGSVKGLKLAVTDFDVAGAAACQRAINQWLTLQTGGVARGDLDVVPGDVAVTPNPFDVGDIVSFEFTIGTRANITETYDLTAKVVAERSQAAWDAVVQFLDSQQRVLALPEIRMAGTAQDHVFIRIAGVPAGTTGSRVSMQLVVRSRSNPGQLSGASSVDTYTVGAAAPLQNPNVSFAGGKVLGANGQITSDGVIEVRSGTTGAVYTVDAVFTVAAEYSMTVSIEPPASAADWTMRVLLPAAPGGAPVPFDVRNSPVPSTNPIRIGLAPKNPGSQDGTLVITMSQTGDARVRTQNLPVHAI